LPSGAIQEGNGKNGRASLTLKPVNGADITKDAPAAPKAQPLPLQPAAKATAPVKAKAESKKQAPAKPDVKADAGSKPATKAN
jgi:hypothetical protein